MKKPCDNCTHCKDPVNCHNKDCSVWQEWFMNAWRKIHNYYLKYVKVRGKTE